jgi:hypothetical protein
MQLSISQHNIKIICGILSLTSSSFFATYRLLQTVTCTGKIQYHESILSFSIYFVLPYFGTDATLRFSDIPEDRIVVPIKDNEATITYYAVYLRNRIEYFKEVFQNN